MVGDRKAESGDSTSGGVEAVDRALTILSCFRDGDEALSLTEIAARTGFYKSTILRLTASLEKAGYLIRRSDKSFALGLELMRLGLLYHRAFRLEDRVRPVLRALLEATGESVSFFRREGDRRVCLFREDSTRGIRENLREGDTLPLASGAAGQVLTRFAAGSAAPARLDELPLMSFGERDPEVAAAAVPVFSGRDGLIGALSISGPLTRFTSETLAEIKPTLIRAGQELSEALGGKYR